MTRQQLSLVSQLGACPDRAAMLVFSLLKLDSCLSVHRNCIVWRHRRESSKNSLFWWSNVCMRQQHYISLTLTDIFSHFISLEVQDRLCSVSSSSLIVPRTCLSTVGGWPTAALKPVRAQVLCQNAGPLQICKQLIVLLLHKYVWTYFCCSRLLQQPRFYKFQLYAAHENFPPIVVPLNCSTPTPSLMQHCYERAFPVATVPTSGTYYHATCTL